MDRWKRIRKFFGQHLVYGFLIAVGGLGAFVAVGFRGYPDDHDPFGRPWPLYVWFCVLALTLEWLIFSDSATETVAQAASGADAAKDHQIATQDQKREASSAVSRWAIATPLMSIVAMVGVGAIYFYHPELINVITKWIPRFPIEILYGPWLSTIVNFSLIALLFADALRRWILCMQGKPVNPGDAFIAREGGYVEPAPDLASEPESEKKIIRIRVLNTLNLVSADCIAGGILSAGLAFVLRRPTLSFLTQVLHINRVVADCTVSLPAVPCPGTTAPLTSLTFVDVGIALLFFAAGLLALFFFVLFYVLLKGDSGKALGAVLRDTLGVLVDIKQLLRALKTPLWITLILLASVSLALAADSNQQYLQQMQTTASGFMEWPPHVTLLVRVLIGGLLATLAVTLAAWVAIFSRRVALQWLREMAGFGQSFLELYWFAALVLSVVNLILLYFNGRLSISGGAAADPGNPWTRLPFPLIASATVVSFLYFCIFRGPSVVKALARLRSSSDGDVAGDTGDT